MVEVHVTERHTFKQCRRKYQFNYREFLQRKEEPTNKMWFGRGIHEGLAYYYSGRGHPIDGFTKWLADQYPDAKLQSMVHEERMRVYEAESLGKGMLDGYYRVALQNDDFQVEKVEVPLGIRIRGTYGVLVGTIDVIARRDGRIWVIDHKTSDSFIDPQILELDDQMTAYLWLVWKTYGEMPAGAIYNQLRRTLPVEPMLLKDGKRLSKDKSIDTTPDIYLKTVKEHGFNPDDYQDILQKLGVENRFFRRELIARNSHELRTFESFLLPEYREMTSRNTPMYPHPTRDCIWGCEFMSLCRSMNEGGDWKALASELYDRDPLRRR